MASDVYKVKDASTSPSVFDFSGPGLVSVSWYHALKTIVQIRIKKKYLPYNVPLTTSPKAFSGMKEDDENIGHKCLFSTVKEAIG